MLTNTVSKFDSEFNIRNLCRAIVTQVLPDPALLAKHGGNWPADAEYAVEYKVHDKQNPIINHQRTVKYFSDEKDLRKWIEEQREWVNSTDHDFTICYSVYEWHHGPEFMDNGWL